jgi:hypothetical protein
VEAELGSVGNVGNSQALFRLVNEKIRRISEGYGFLTGTATLLCECTDLRCVAQIDLTFEDYDGVCSRPSQFMVVPGHEIADADVVRRTESFLVVREPPLQ